MNLKISNDKKIALIQREFNDVFPFLKLEFFDFPHGSGKGSPKKQMKNPSLSLEECARKAVQEGELIINESQTVGEVEDMFYQLYELSVQIFRKSGKLWLETTFTDDWTLKQQNDQGRELSFGEEE